MLGWSLTAGAVAWIVFSPRLVFWVEERFFMTQALVVTDDPNSPDCQWCSLMTEGERFGWFTGSLAMGICALFLGVFLVRSIPQRENFP